MQEKIPKVSIIIPVYNVEKFLQPCIDSLLGQTLQDIEMIFVNDASQDNSLEILLKNAEKFPDRIKIINSTENLCQGGARNLGIKAAQARYIGFVDSDDIVHPDMFKLLYEKTLETNADVTFVQYAAITENMNLSTAVKKVGAGMPLIQWHKNLLALDSKKLNDSERMDLMCYPIGGGVCGLWKKKLIFENHILFPEHLKYEDNYWGSLIKCYISKVVFIPRIMYFYRDNSNSTVRSRNVSYHLDRIKIEKDLLSEAQKRKFFDKYYSAWEYMYISRYAFNSYYLFGTAFDEPLYEQMRFLMDDLKLVFPKWERNKYYQELTSIKMKLKNKIVSKFPWQYAKINWGFRILKRDILRNFGIVKN